MFVVRNCPSEQPRIIHGEEWSLTKDTYYHRQSDHEGTYWDFPEPSPINLPGKAYAKENIAELCPFCLICPFD